MVWILYHAALQARTVVPNFLWGKWEWWYMKVNHYPLASVMVILFGLAFLTACSQFRRMKVYQVDDETKRLLIKVVQSGKIIKKNDRG